LIGEFLNMRESDTQSPGYKMDGLDAERGESTPEEDQFTGNELDEKDEPTPEEEDSESSERNYKGKRWILLCIALGLCVLVGLGYLVTKRGRIHVISNQNEKAPQYNRLAIPEDQLLLFHSFIIPFHENKDFTYIAFSISFNVPNKGVRREMMEKKSQLRGMVYDILTQEINRVREVPPLEVLKQVILGGVNAVLSSGMVGEVYIIRFMAV
jgi:flagellar basal body-associated protein FliL